MTDQLPVRIDDLPMSLVDVAETLGLRVALKLIAHFGGQEMRVPKKPRPDHPIIVALGEADGEALCAFLADNTIYVPHGRTGATRRNVLALERDGKGRREIAQLLGISQRHVRRLANARRDNSPNQLNFFDDI